MPNPIPCICGTCETEGKYYVCEGCKRTAPWCYGCADEYFDYCDDCALLLDKGVAPENLLQMINDAEPSNTGLFKFLRNFLGFLK